MDACPASHGVLKTMLPLLRNMIHDDSPTVRLAMVSLLQKVKTTRGMKFYDVVTVPHLHARIADEQVRERLSGFSDRCFSFRMNALSGLFR